MTTLQITSDKKLFDYRALQIAIISKYGDFDEFAKVLGMSERSLSNKLSQKTKMRVKEIVQMADAIGISPDAFFIERK